MKLLALDLSTNVGWAWWKDHKVPPVCGTEKLPKVLDPDDYAGRTWPLSQWLNDFIKTALPDGVAFESPFVPNGFSIGKLQTTAHTIRLQISLASTIETVTRRWNIRCVEVGTQAAKIAMVGFGQRPKDQPSFNWKREMLIAATRAGYRVSNDHEADAVAVGKIAAEHFWGVSV